MSDPDRNHEEPIDRDNAIPSSSAQNEEAEADARLFAELDAGEQTADVNSAPEEEIDDVGARHALPLQTTPEDEIREEPSQSEIIASVEDAVETEESRQDETQVGANLRFVGPAATESSDDETPSVYSDDTAVLSVEELHDSGKVVTFDTLDPLETPNATSYDSPLLVEAVKLPDDTVDAPATGSFEDLTLAEALSQLRRAPLTTLRALIEVARTPVALSRKTPALRPAYAPAGVRGETQAAARVPAQVTLPGLRRPAPKVSIRDTTPEIPQIEDAPSARLEMLQLALRVVAFALAWWGTVTMVSAPSRSEADGLNVGLPLLLVGFVVWLVSEFLGRRADFSLLPGANVADTGVNFSELVPRLAVLAVGIALGGVGVWFNKDNTFTFPGVAAWFASIALCVMALAPKGWSLRKFVERVEHIRPSFNWVWLALVVITLVGAYFRLTSLDLVPPEMTSDHKEMLIDSQRVLDGRTDVFFAGNGGREPIQFYALAFVSQLPGLSMDFQTLKLLNAIEGILTIPVMFWMGRAVIGGRERRLGTLVGLLASAFVAVSYWHEIISRLGERIVLMPLATALLIVFLARALRYNRRGDYLWAGLALGLGLYTYQAFRMMPLVVIVAGIIALFFYLRQARELRRLVLNFFAMGLVALIVYLPLFGYSLQFPEDYWRRTSGRLFGDEITQTTDENGNLIFRQPTIQERIEAFQQNFPALLNNIRNALLMYNWKGDVAWFQNYPNEPAFDPITGGLIVVGAAAWLGRMFRRRDPFTWLFPAMFLIMLLPSAFAIAQPIENPSFTRMSGTLPLAFLLVALPLALILQSALRLAGGFVGVLVAGVVAVGLVAASYAANYNTYFVDYQQTYLVSSYPYSEAGEYLRGFGDSFGYGNAFIINRPAWWDHRAVGIAAGQMNYPNGIPSLANVPQFLQAARDHAAPYTLDVEKDILFFYAGDDLATHEWLLAKFPDGFWQLIQTYQPEDTFYMFRVPALGTVGFEAFFEDASDDDLSQEVG